MQPMTHLWFSKGRAGISISLCGEDLDHPALEFALVQARIFMQICPQFSLLSSKCSPRFAVGRWVVETEIATVLWEDLSCLPTVAMETDAAGGSLELMSFKQWHCQTRLTDVVALDLPDESRRQQPSWLFVERQSHVYCDILNVQLFVALFVNCQLAKELWSNSRDDAGLLVVATAVATVWGTQGIPWVNPTVWRFLHHDWDLCRLLGLLRKRQVDGDEGVD